MILPLKKGIIWGFYAMVFGTCGNLSQSLNREKILLFDGYTLIKAMDIL